MSRASSSSTFAAAGGAGFAGRDGCAGYEVETGSTSARGSRRLYWSWSGSRTSRSALEPETCFRERATLTATTMAPTTAAAMTRFITA
ncbi:MAG TPA: hypothetical protein VIZ00_03660 [Streptosporangiaceae bacterium]